MLKVSTAANVRNQSLYYKQTCLDDSTELIFFHEHDEQQYKIIDKLNRNS